MVDPYAIISLRKILEELSAVFILKNLFILIYLSMQISLFSAYNYKNKK